MAGGRPPEPIGWVVAPGRSRRIAFRGWFERLRTFGTDPRLRIGVCRLILVTGKIRERSPDRLTVTSRGIAYAPARAASAPLRAVSSCVCRRRARGRPRRRRRCADPDGPILREEQHPLRSLPVVHLHDRSLRDLLLSRAGTASGARGGVRRERLPAGQRGSQTRSVVQGAADSVQDPQRIRAAERRSARRFLRGRRRVRRADTRPHAAADRRPTRPALRTHHPRADAHLRVRHHPAVAHPPQRAVVGERGAVGLRARPVEPDRPDVGARRGRRRHRAEDDRARRLRQHEQPAPHLQPGPRRLRIHRGEVRQGRHPSVPLLAAQERHRRRRRRVRRGPSDEEGGVRSGLRAVPQRPLQAVPGQGASGRLRPEPGAEPGKDLIRRSALDRAVPVGRSHRGRHRQSQGP